MNSEENRDRHIFEIITRWIANSFKNIFKVIKEINYKRFLAFTTVTLTNHLDSSRKTPTYLQITCYKCLSSIVSARLATLETLKITFQLANKTTLAFPFCFNLSPIHYKSWKGMKQQLGTFAISVDTKPREKEGTVSKTPVPPLTNTI